MWIPTWPSTSALKYSDRFAALFCSSAALSISDSKRISQKKKEKKKKRKKKRLGFHKSPPGISTMQSATR